MGMTLVYWNRPHKQTHWKVNRWVKLYICKTMYKVTHQKIWTPEGFLSQSHFIEFYSCLLGRVKPWKEGSLFITRSVPMKERRFRGVRNAAWAAVDPSICQKAFSILCSRTPNLAIGKYSIHSSYGVSSKSMSKAASASLKVIETSHSSFLANLNRARR